MSDALGYEVLGRALLENGLNPAFGLLGDANMMPIVSGVAEGLSYVGARHESGAVCMAAGYAMASGRVGFATVTRGPGLSNAITALVSAARDRVPLVLFAGAAHSYDRYGPQVIDQETLLHGTGVRTLTVASADTLCASVAAAAGLAEAERRPVVLNIPTDLLETGAPGQVVLRPRPAPATPSYAREPDPQLIRQAARLLVKARRPIILVGCGADPALASSIADLAKRTGALLATTLLASGLFPHDEFSVGFIGGFAVDAVREIMARADVVLAFGASLNAYTTDRGTLLRNATVVQVDHDPQSLDRHYTSDLPIAGDVAEVVAALAASVTATPRVGAGYRTPDIAERLAETRWAAHYPDASDESGIDPRTLLRAIDERVGDRRRVVVDVGAFGTFPCQVMRTFRPNQLLPCFGFGSIGLALPTALGVKVAAPDDTVVCVVGDGGLLTSLPELESLARTGIPAITVVINDHAYGAEVHTLRKEGVEPTMAQFPATDFAAIAEKLGMAAIRIDSVADLARLPERLDDLRQPLLVDAHVTPHVIADKFQ